MRLATQSLEQGFSSESRRPFRRRLRSPLRDHPGSPPLTLLTFLACCAHYPPVDRIGARWLSCWRAPAPGSSRSVPPSPLPRRVGVHITAFGACTGFTRVTARRIARPPLVDFVARLRPARLPGLAARQLSNLTINYSSGSFPHWYSAPLGHTRKRLFHKKEPAAYELVG